MVVPARAPWMVVLEDGNPSLGEVFVEIGTNTPAHVTTSPIHGCKLGKTYTR